MGIRIGNIIEMKKNEKISEKKYKAEKPDETEELNIKIKKDDKSIERRKERH